MPLIQGKSDETRGENIATEIAAGKSPEQAAAIAYSIQRENKDSSPVSSLPETQTAAETAERGMKYWGIGE
jgi:hypothetical protein